MAVNWDEFTPEEPTVSEIDTVEAAPVETNWEDFEPVDWSEYAPIEEKPLPEAKAYEPTVWDKVRDYFPGNKDRASNERIARELALDKGVSIEEIYEGAGGARPMLNPEGRAPVRAFTEGAGIAVEQAPDIIPGVANTVLRTIRGGDTDIDDDNWLDQAINETEVEPPEDADPNYQAFQNLGKNFGYSFTTLGAGAMAFVGGTSAGGPIAGAGASMAASGAVAFRGSKDEFLDRAREYMDAQYVELYGRPMNQDEWSGLYNDFNGAANKYGAWEAIPEAAGNLIFIKAFARPLRGVKGTALEAAKAKANEVAGRAAQVLATENATEIATAMGQNRAELESGLTDRELTLPGAIREVLIPTTLLTATMGVGAGAIKTGAGMIPKRKGIDTVTQFKATHKVSGGVDAQQATRGGVPIPDTYVDKSGKTYRDPSAVEQPVIPGSAFDAGPLDANAQMEAIKAEVFGGETGPAINQGIINAIAGAGPGVTDHAARFAGPEAPGTPQRTAEANQGIINQVYQEGQPAAVQEPTTPEPIGIDVDGAPIYAKPAISEEERAQKEAAGISVAQDITEAAHEAATSPLNDKVATEPQKEQGVYEKGHKTVQGFDLSIENPAGSKRQPEWPTLKHHYGYFKGSIGADSIANPKPHQVEHVDAIIKKDVDISPDSPIWVVDQYIDGAMDEHKVVLGADSEQDAREVYQSMYEEDWDGLHAITQATKEEVDAWIARVKADNSLRKVEYAKLPPSIDQETKTPKEQALSAKAKGEVVKEPELTGGEQAIPMPYASGNSSPKMFKAALKAGAGMGVGVDVSLLSQNMLDLMVQAIYDGHSIFVDSGAFSAFKLAKKNGLAINDVNFDKVLERYLMLAEMAGTPKQGGAGNLMVVAPDVIGSQADTLKQLEKYKDKLAQIDSYGAEIVIPMQRGELSQREALDRIREIMGNTPFVVGIPSKAAALSQAEVRDLLSGDYKPERIHLLGAARPSSMHPRMNVIREIYQDDVPTVTADANLLRARLDDLKGLEGDDRSTKMTEILRDEIPVELLRAPDVEVKELARKPTKAATTPKELAKKPEKPQQQALKVLRYQWMRNKEGGQKFGNKMEIRPLTAKLFGLHLKNKLRSQAKTFKAYKEMYPENTHIAIYKVATDRKWKMEGVGTQAELLDNLTDSVERGWALPVDSFTGTEAITQARTADSEVAPAEEQKVIVPRGPKLELVQKAEKPAPEPAAEPVDEYIKFDGQDITYQVFDEADNEYSVTEDAGKVMRRVDARIEALEEVRRKCA